MWNGVERPTDLSRAHIVRADVAGGRAFLFADARALDEKILVDDPRRRGDEISPADISAQSFRKIYPAAVTKTNGRPAGCGIERIQPTRRGKENAPRRSVGPIDHAAVCVRLPS